MQKDLQVQDAALKFLKQTNVLGPVVSSPMTPISKSNSEDLETNYTPNVGAVETVEWNGKDLTKLGGETPVEVCKNIAEAIWTRDGLKKIRTDGKQDISEKEDSSQGEAKKRKIRPQSSPVRTSLYRRAVRIALGPVHTKELYNYTRRLVNQSGTDASKKKDSTKQLFVEPPENADDVDLQTATRSEMAHE